MSEAILELNADARTGLGKGASRRLRRKENLVPAIMYGGKEKATPISILHNKLMQALNHEAFYSSIITVKVDGKEQKVVLKDLHRHPYKKQILHADFLRVSGTDVITMKVPLHFINEDKCPGVKAGGIINHSAVDLEIKCQAKNLPEFIEIDLANLELDHSIHLSEIKLPKGVEIVSLLHGTSHDSAVVNVHPPKGTKSDLEDESKPEETEAKAEEKDKK